MKNLVAIALTFACFGVAYPRAIVPRPDAVEGVSADKAGSSLYVACGSRSLAESAKLLTSTTFWDGSICAARDGGSGGNASELGGQPPCRADGSTLRAQQVLLRL